MAPQHFTPPPTPPQPLVTELKNNYHKKNVTETLNVTHSDPVCFVCFLTSGHITHVEEVVILDTKMLSNLLHSSYLNFCALCTHAHTHTPLFTSQPYTVPAKSLETPLK